MPNKSSGTVPAQTVRELGLPGRAVTALSRAGITAVDDLSGLTRAELAAIPGLGAGMVSAIRAVVPEPVGTLGRTVRLPAVRPAGPVPEADDEESPAAPSIPSFASLRDARRRTPVDLLLPPHPEVREPAAEPARPAAPRPVTPRPPEWADLWHLGLRVARWWLHQPVATVRRLLG
ncbi:helix-hairpin-helix domain-containing protein [Blastococcus atacamensis]|uniref:helix-hairpin-helix domain-containing protein n=1 Tax=Blastococcus atacamensis TaxID=2070508 RepID=UPI000CEBBD89|nr:DNA-directed RNA polymerase subunit alpha C-terminal domain-containing protein [Blastococcus atacamensis]